MSEKDSGNKNNVRYMTVSMVFIVVTVFCALFLMYYFFRRNYDVRDHTALRDEKEEDLELLENGEKKEYYNGIEIPKPGIDWAELKGANQDIFAYIFIPSTRVDCPVLKNPDADDYYLTHSSFGAEDAEGSVFARFYAQTDFTDSNTILYAKEADAGGLFATLKYFEDADFFDRTQYLFIYTPVKTFIFQIFAAYRYGEVKLSDDFSSEEEFSEYLNEVVSQPDKNAHFRTNTLVKLNGNARIVSCAMLSGEDGEIGYVVQGVLLNYED